MNIPIDKAVLEQALAALEQINSPYWSDFVTPHIAQLREALAQPEHDDAAYKEAVSLATALFKKHFAHEEHYASGQVVWSPCDTAAGVISQIDNMVSGLVQPQPVQEPVILSASQQWQYKYCTNIPERLSYEQWAKSKGHAVTLEGDGTYSGGITAQHDWYVWLEASKQAQPQPVQEPVAPVGTVTRYLGNDGYMKWAFQPEAAAWLVPRDQRAAERGAESCFSVYASPQVQPLSDEQIADAYEAMSIQNHLTWTAYLAGARHAEAAHGITKGTT